MTDQLLLDFTASKAERDEAIARVEDHADIDWWHAALDALYSLALARPTFISDDVWTTGLEKPAEARALGAVMQRAKKLGWIAPTNTFVPTAQVKSHACPRRRWVSVIYNGEAS